MAWKKSWSMGQGPLGMAAVLLGCVDLHYVHYVGVRVLKLLLFCVVSLGFFLSMHSSSYYVIYGFQIFAR